MTDQVVSNDTRWRNVLFYTAAIIRQLTEVCLKKINVENGNREGKHGRMII